MPDINPTADGTISLTLTLDTIYTITTTTGQRKGEALFPPDSAPFPSNYFDDFNNYPADGEAKYFTDQTGTWVIHIQNENSTMRQIVQGKTIAWCTESEYPITVIGDLGMSNIEVSYDVIFEEPAQSIIGARVPAAGCTNVYQKGYYFFVSYTGQWTLKAGSTVLKTGTSNSWHPQSNRLKLNVMNNMITASINNIVQVSVTDNSFSYGYAAVGSTWNYVQFDNFNLISFPLNCGSGTHVLVGPCNELPSSSWVFSDTLTISWKNDTTQCLDIGPLDPRSGYPSAIISKCDPGNLNQLWKFNENKIIHLKTNYCLDITGALESPCSGVEIYPCVDGAMNEEWQLNISKGLIISMVTDSCLSVGN
jgi:hypothetical protein